MKLTVEAVTDLSDSCLAKDITNPENIFIEGILTKGYYDPKKLEENKSKIIELLSEWPSEFKRSQGGWSFMNACIDKNGRQWCDCHSTMELLLMLGMAIGLVTFPMPRELWKALPGGMPYFVIDLD